MTAFEKAHRLVSQLADDFRTHEQKYLSPNYQEAEARKDFIDKFFIALGWDVNHDTQKNPYEQVLSDLDAHMGSRRASACTGIV